MAKVSNLTTTAPKTKVLRGVIDDGTREVPLVNKFGKLICNVYFRPADFSILDRYNDFMKDFENVVKPLADININRDGTANFDRDWEVLKAVEDEVKRRFNDLFDMDEADAIFAKRNAFSSVGGEFFCYRVLVALAEIIETAIEEEATLSQARVNKYLTPQPETVEGAVDAGDITENA